MAKVMQIKTAIIYGLLLQNVLPALAQDKLVRVTSATDLYDGARCIITNKTSAGYCDLRMKQHPNYPSDSIQMMVHSKVYTTLDELAANTIVFIVKEAEGNLYLYDSQRERYLNEVDRQQPNYTVLNSLCLLTADQRTTGIVQIETDSETYLRIGSRYCKHHTSSADYRLVGKTNSSYLPVQLYLVKTQNPPSTLSLSTSQDLGDTDFKGDVVLERTFYNDCLNTLVLPFAVEHPQSVFGSETVCYEPQSGTDNALTFRKMAADERLEANRPYLITGTFAPAPYRIADTQVTYATTQSDPTYDMGSMRLHGVYQRQQMGGTERFALYKQQFRSCRKVSNLSIEPYKWFVESDNANSKPSVWRVALKKELSHIGH